MTDEALVFSDRLLETKDSIRLAIARAGAGSTSLHDVEDAIETLRAAQIPRLVVADCAAPGVMTLIRALREEPRLHAVPVVIIVPDPSTASFEEAHALGADGVVVTGNWQSLTRCVATLLTLEPPRRIPVVHGTVLLIDRSVQRRRAFGRVMGRAGFGPAFAENRSEADEQIAGAAPRAIVLHHELLDGGSLAYAEDLHRRTGAAVLVLASTRDVPAMGARAERVEGMGVASELSAPTDLLFLLGELLRPDVDEVRASRRLLYAAICGFRAAGAGEVEHGLSYNISREGLYVRTLNPPAVGTRLWIELSPPGEEPLVHLRGDLVWRRIPEPASPGGPTPPGFGLRLVAEACPGPDLELYRRGYRWLLEQGRRGARSRDEREDETGEHAAA